MSEDYLNIYQTCRKSTDLTQEQAAERLEVSVESLKCYELDLRTPPNALVYRMTLVYRAPWLALLHVQKTSDILGVLPERMELQPLSLAAIRLYNRMVAFAKTRPDQQLLLIAEDGIIDQTERPIFDAIVAELMEVVGAVYQVRFAPEGKSWDDPLRTYH